MYICSKVRHLSNTTAFSVFVKIFRCSGKLQELSILDISPTRQNTAQFNCFTA